LLKAWKPAGERWIGIIKCHGLVGLLVVVPCLLGITAAACSLAAGNLAALVAMALDGGDQPGHRLTGRPRGMLTSQRTVALVTCTRNLGCCPLRLVYGPAIKGT